jgi:hypothetical protein
VKKAATLALVAVLAAGCGGRSSRPSFEQAHGWHTLAEPGQIVSAATVAFAAADRSQSAPIHTVASLPRRGILIWVPARSRSNHRRRPPLLRVQNMANARPEGFLVPGTARVLQTESKRWVVYVWVFFGAAHPSRSTIATANAELARLMF